jgi:WD40 repeat protein
VRLWDGSTGKFVVTLRSHIQRVYQCCWSADSRFLLSGSQVRRHALPPHHAISFHVISYHSM